MQDRELKSIEQLTAEIYGCTGLQGELVRRAFFGGKGWMLERHPHLAHGTPLEHRSRRTPRTITGRRFRRQPRPPSRARSAARRGGTRAGPDDGDPHPASRERAATGAVA